MKQSEAVREALNSYHFQNGRRVNHKVVNQCLNVIKALEKREKELTK